MARRLTTSFMQNKQIHAQCMDEHLNLILQHAVERRTVKTEGAGAAEGCVCRYVRV